MSQVETNNNKSGAIECVVSMLDVHMCREWVLQQLHPDGAYCPGCDKKIDGDDALDNFWEERRTYCKFCHKQFTARTDTAINGTGLDMREIYLFCLLVEFAVLDKRIAEVLGIHPDSVGNWKRRIEGWGI